MNDTISQQQIALPKDPQARREYKKTVEYKTLLEAKRKAARNAINKLRQQQSNNVKRLAYEKALGSYTGKIVNYRNEGHYFVLEDGRVYSYPYCDFVKPCKTNDGYLYISIKTRSESKRMLVRRLVAECFLKPSPGRDEVNHEDMNKENNHYTNLSYCTRKENLRHAIANGANIAGILTPRQGEKVWSAKLKNEQVLEIRDFYSKGFTAKELSMMYHLTTNHVYRIIHRKTWKHL